MCTTKNDAGTIALACAALVANCDAALASDANAAVKAAMRDLRADALRIGNAAARKAGV